MSMSFLVNKICCNSLFPSPHNKNNWDVCKKTSNVIIQSHWVRNSAIPHLKLNNNFSWNYHHHFTLHSINNGGTTAHGLPDSQKISAEPEGSMEGNDGRQERSLSATKILEQLKRYGASGVLSYGLLNTAYYLTTFLLVWFYFAPAPGKMGYLAAVSRFLKVMAMVWAGSQVTKLLRAAGALALAPLVDRGLSWFTVRYKFESRGKAFFTVVAFCLSLALIMFLAVTLLSA
ncbi:uncharacterized protein LOC110700637 isoform X2 [Chenopodium quinoa]|uniref:Uncharacterized protein n=1 Tax=Chenopodium quinoa TaxID=63459 RepID=A0A803MUL3_CHEQI|nr:uncharacterized protein LOC110700637 isoform X2 [Chenopodium quinoa]